MRNYAYDKKIIILAKFLKIVVFM